MANPKGPTKHGVSSRPPDLSAEAVGRRVRECAERLRHAIRAVVDQIPSAAEGPQALARDLKVHKSLASRLLSAVRLDDPLAVVRHLPRSEGLGIFLRAAESFVGKDSVGTAKTAVGEFQTLVKRDLGGWDKLDVAIGAWLPEAREKAELAAGRQMYSGMCGIIGVTTDVRVPTVIAYPNSDGENIDATILSTNLGLRRLRPGKEIPIESLGPHPGQPDTSTGVTSLSDGQGPGGLPLLKGFCSSPLPPFRVIEVNHLREFLVTGDGFGARSGVDLCVGVVVRKIRPLYQPESGPRIRVGASVTIGIPAKTLVFNLLVEDSVYEGCEPELVLHQTTERGPANMNDRTRDIDCMESTASVQYLGRGPQCFHMTEYARYVELVQHACDKVGWDVNRLRGYRCRVQYPFAIAQYSILFKPPERGERT